ncbi:HAMP domain-containing sensor histidine kinase [Klenkia sp. PcliD-1-E]|uniref:sensor histidine kinase n=1 Tax=Klenkia sp. PcliD-1-E TaxID=2954492 RepID=UPI002097B99E|nr:HAMP domain-containing sensor histidine kinase [Klenkia sp. PcliD-1-E]MCO7220056.1 HAMP domain-containing histidine kinase [Klenkia sp. PcliD-1-E]
MRARAARTSLRSRLSWSATVVVALWVLLLAVGANELLARVLAGQADDVLQARAEAVAQTVDVAADGTVTVLDGRDDQALDVGTWIIDGAGRIVETPSGSTAALDRQAVDLAAQGARTVDLGDDLRLRALPITDGGQQVAAVVTSTSLSPYRQVERTALLGSVGVALLLVVVVHLVLRANVTRALRPVQDMTTQAGRWSADDTDLRFGDGPRPAELAELAGTLDQLLDRQAAVLRHEQRFTEELSHELRTPLARVQAEIDLLRAQPRDARALADAHAAIDRSTRAMASILETMLSAARSAEAVTPGRTRLVDALVVLADPDAQDVRVPVTIVGDPDLVVGVDVDVLVRALSPVVDNAVRFATSHVRIQAGASSGHLVVTVLDDGPGMTEQSADRAFDPGYRGDPDDGHTGAGLGLALTRRLVLAAGGAVTAVAGDHGRIEIVLPRG